MTLRNNLIASPGDAIAGRLARDFHIDPDVHSMLIREIDRAVLDEREACAKDGEACEARHGERGAARGDPARGRARAGQRGALQHAVQGGGQLAVARARSRIGKIIRGHGELFA